MSTLTVTLKLVSNNSTTDPLNFGEADTLTVTSPISALSRDNITTAAAKNILTAAANTVKTYVYMKNLDATNFVEAKDDAGNVLIELGPGEFAFFPVQGSIGLEVQADTATCEVEYGFWTAN
jgi:hypothetical protein